VNLPKKVKLVLNGLKIKEIVILTFLILKPVILLN
jgi:hypothetical protein